MARRVFPHVSVSIVKVSDGYKTEAIYFPTSASSGRPAGEVYSERKSDALYAARYYRDEYLGGDRGSDVESVTIDDGRTKQTFLRKSQRSRSRR